MANKYSNNYQRKNRENNFKKSQFNNQHSIKKDKLFKNMKKKAYLGEKTNNELF